MKITITEKEYELMTWAIFELADNALLNEKLRVETVALVNKLMIQHDKQEHT